MHRRRLLGWACYIAAVEPDVGYPLLRAFHELVPEGRGGTPEWADKSRGRITRVTYVQDTGQAIPVPTPEVVELAHQGKKIQALGLYRRLNPGISIYQAKDVIDEILSPKSSS